MPTNPLKPLPTDEEVDAYIASKASSLGIDPIKAINVSRAERANRSGGWIGDSGSSFGPFQLHIGGIASGLNAGKGLGDDFIRVTGLDPRNIADTWKQQVDFALTNVSQTGWYNFHAAAQLGYSIWEGIKTTVGGIVQGGLRYFFPLVGYAGSPKSTYHTPGATDLFAPEGTDVRSIAEGKVTSVGSSGPGGNNIVITGIDGLTYYYAHFRDAVALKAGDFVAAGQKIGKVGKTGNAADTDAHVHIGIGYGIQEGTGATGGTGKNFDAQSFLSNILSSGGASPTTEGVIRGAASGLSSLDISGALSSAFSSFFSGGTQELSNYVKDRAASIAFLTFGIVLILVGVFAFASENSTVRTIVKTGAGFVPGGVGKVATAAL